MPRRWQRLGVVSGLSAVSVMLMLLSRGHLDALTAPGPMNTGHESLDCQDCHLDERGSTRQQVQASVAWWLGSREDRVYIGTRPAQSEQCIECHERPDDQHPIYRFREPRFEEARRELGADQCSSCHAEHSGARVTQEATFCETCHEELALKNDPLDTSHAALIAQGRWATCLSCHDFHGNHRYEVPTRLSDAFSVEEVRSYLDGDRSLYSADRKHPAKSSARPPSAP